VQPVSCRQMCGPPHGSCGVSAPDRAGGPGSDVDGRRARSDSAPATSLPVQLATAHPGPQSWTTAGPRGRLPCTTVSSGDLASAERISRPGQPPAQPSRGQGDNFALPSSSADGRVDGPAPFAPADWLPERWS
jgi:hypothetical protein